MIQKIEKWKSPNQNSKKEKQFFKNKDSLKDFWDNIKHINIHIIRVPEGEERVKEAENVFAEIMAENFLNLKKETENQVQEVQKVPNKMNPKRPTQYISKLKRQKSKKEF